MRRGCRQSQRRGEPTGSRAVRPVTRGVIAVLFDLMSQGSATPELAARGDIPDPHARTLAVQIAPDGQHALILLDIASGADVYEYQVLCERVGDGWVESISGNGPGWSSTIYGDDTQPNCGVLTAWGPAPADAEVAIFSYAGGEYAQPVTNGYYLFAAWDAPDDSIEVAALLRFGP